MNFSGFQPPAYFYSLSNPARHGLLLLADRIDEFARDGLERFIAQQLHGAVVQG